jgi:hypothetical protein
MLEYYSAEMEYCLLLRCRLSRILENSTNIYVLKLIAGHHMKCLHRCHHVVWVVHASNRGTVYDMNDGFLRN